MATAINSSVATPVPAGSDFVLEYIVFDQTTGLPGNLSGSTCSVKICPRGEPNIVTLTLSGTVTDTNVFEVTLLAEDTISLIGLYSHQPIIVDGGRPYRSTSGLLNFEAAIN